MTSALVVKEVVCSGQPLQTRGDAGNQDGGVFPTENAPTENYEEDHKMKRLLISTLMAALMPGAACLAAIIVDVNKDVCNGTGQPVFGFKIVLLGTPTVLSHYDGFPNGWRFAAFSQTVVAAAEGQTTILQWSQPRSAGGAPEPVPLPGNEWVHVGYRLAQPADVLEAYWTNESGMLVPGGQIRQPGQFFEWEDGTIVVTIKNSLRDGKPLTVRVFGHLFWGSSMSLDSLNRNNPSLNDGDLKTVPGAEGDITLDHNVSKTFRVQVPVSMLADPGKPPALLLVKGDPKKESFRDFAQFYREPPKVPAVSQGVLVVLAALVLATGGIAIARRPRHATI